MPSIRGLDQLLCGYREASRENAGPASGQGVPPIADFSHPGRPVPLDPDYYSLASGS